MLVNSAWRAYLRDRKDSADLSYRKKNMIVGRGNLWPTDLGKCHRAAILRTESDHKSADFSDTSLDYMFTGEMTEEHTAAALKHIYGNRLSTQVDLRVGCWSGKADFILDHLTEDALIIEHKATSETKWDKNRSSELPRIEHIGQVITYRHLYHRLYNIIPRTMLVYKAWGKLAEYELILDDEDEDIIHIHGEVDGVSSLRIIRYDVLAEMNALEYAYDNNILPERQEKKYKHCEFAGKPSCPFYTYCWGG